MPSYDCLCQSCMKTFEIRASVAEYSKNPKPQCPECGSQDVVRVFSRFNVMRSRGRSRPSFGGCGPMAGPGCCG